MAQAQRAAPRNISVSQIKERQSMYIDRTDEKEASPPNFAVPPPPVLLP
jgi:hypothetical protein